MVKHFFFPFYVDSFISGTVGMTCEEVGAYIRLLCYQFQCERIPIGDAKMIKRIAGTKIDLKFVLKKFPNGVNNKMFEVMSHIYSKSQKAQASANMRWHSDGNADGMLYKVKVKDKDKEDTFGVFTTLSEREKAPEGMPTHVKDALLGLTKKIRQER